MLSSYRPLLQDLVKWNLLLFNFRILLLGASKNSATLKTIHTPKCASIQRFIRQSRLPNLRLLLQGLGISRTRILGHRATTSHVRSAISLGPIKHFLRKSYQFSHGQS